MPENGNENDNVVAVADLPHINWNENNIHIAVERIKIQREFDRNIQGGNIVQEEINNRLRGREEQIAEIEIANNFVEFPQYLNDIFGASRTQVVKSSNSKTKVYIEDDSDMREKGLKINNLKNKIETKLTTGEINLSVCNNLLSYYRKKYCNSLAASENLNIFPINTIIDIKDNKNFRKDYKPTVSAIVLGYVIHNKIFNNIDELYNYYRSNKSKTSVIEILVYVINNNNYKLNSEEEKIKFKFKSNYFTKIPVSDFIRNNKNNTLEILNKFPIKIESGLLSGKVFGLSFIKNKLVDTIVKDYEIKMSISKKIGETYYIIIPYTNEETGKTGELKFVMNDVSFIFPDIKGYNIPKDKTMVIGSNVKIKVNTPRLNTNTILTIQNIKPNPQSKRICKNSKTKQLDIIMCSTQEGSVFRFRAKELKLIDNKNDSKTSIKA